MEKIRNGVVFFLFILTLLGTRVPIFPEDVKRKISGNKENRLYFFKIRRVEKVLTRIPCVYWKFKINGPAHIEIFFRSSKGDKRIFDFLNKGHRIARYNSFTGLNECHRPFGNKWESGLVAIYYYKVTWINSGRVIKRTVLVK